MKRFLLISLLLLLGTDLAAQVLPFRNYSIEHGLSESVVNDILQDRNGYIWAATSYGLNRFDGFTFQDYYEENGLKNNRIHSLYEDSNGTIWVGTASGASIAASDSIKTPEELEPIENAILDFFEDENGNLWIATDGAGVWKLDQQDELVQYSEEEGLANNRVRSIQQDSDGTLWFATRGGLSRFSDEDFQNYDTAEGLPDEKLRDLALDQNGDLWIATRGGLSYMQNGTFQNYTENDGLVHNLIQSISFDERDNLWIGTEQGLSRFLDGEFTNYLSNTGLPNEIIYSTFIDREDNLWVGTFGGGMSIFLGDYIQNYTVEEGLPNNMVTSVTQDQSGLYWIGTYGGGISRLQNSEFFTITSRDGLVDDKVYETMVDRENRLLIGTRWGLSIYLDGSFSNYEPEQLQSRMIRDIIQHRETDEYWVATYENGVFQFQNGEVTLYNEDKGLASNTVLAIEQDEDGSFWFATYGGVSHFKDKEFTNYTTQQGLPNNGVIDIMKDQDGVIWVSTFNGIARFNGERFVAITEADGLPDEVGYFITQDDNGIYWVGTKEGIVRFDYQQYNTAEPPERGDAFSLYTQDQGLAADEMNAGAIFKDADGVLWMGSVGGLSRLDPNLLRLNDRAPKLHIENLVVSGERMEPKDNFEIKGDDHNVSFEFIGINFTAPRQVTYEYRLRGSGEGWQQTSDRSVRFSALQAGDYEFEVRAKNNNGVWSTESASLSFSVIPPFWLRWWFFTLLGLLVLGIVLFIYNYYRVRKMVDIERMRVRIASDLHDDVGSALTEIALQSDFLQATEADKSIQQSLHQIGEQSRRIVSSLDDIVWSIDARNDTLGDLTDRMQDYINNMLPQKEVEYHFDDIDMDEKLTVTMKENLYLIFKEAINNIAKHSNATKVEVVLQSTNGTFDLYIHDDGEGGATHKKTGHGLRNMKMRAKRINADITFENSDGFTVHLSGNGI